MNGFICLYKGKRLEIYADTAYDASKEAAKQFKAKKIWEVVVHLAELDGTPYVHKFTD